MMRRLFSPKWVLIHTGVIGLVVLMANLGLWQLNRLEEKKAFNTVVSTRTTEPVDSLAHVLTPQTQPADVEWRRVSVTGTYVATSAITIINRSQNGSAGFNSALAFQTADGKLLLVNRGFIPLAMKTPTPPQGQLTVVGYLHRTQLRSGIAPADLSGADVREFQRFDINRISTTWQGPVYSMYLQLLKESPSPNSQWPASVALPTLDEGSHLSYAFQWFFFCLVALAAWVVVIRRRLAMTTPVDQVQTSA